MTKTKAEYHSSQKPEYLSAPQMAKRLGFSDNTVRRYLQRFKETLPVKKKVGNFWKYPVDPTLDQLNNIYTWYKRGMSRKEIMNLLSNEDDATLPPSDKFDILGQKIDALTNAVTQLHTLFRNHPSMISGSENIIHEITGAANNLIPDTTMTNDDATTVTPKEKKQTKTTMPPTGRGKKSKINESTVNKGRFEGDTGVECSGGTDTMPTPDWQDDLEAYKRYVVGIIIDLKDQGKTLKKIKAELEGQGLKTFTGLDAWAVGTISNLYRKHKGKNL